MLVAIMQALQLYFGYADSTFFYSYVGGSFMHVTVSVAITQLKVFAAFRQVTVSALNMWVTIFNFYCSYAGGRFCCDIMQMVHSAVHNCFYCKVQVTFFVKAT